MGCFCIHLFDSIGRSRDAFGIQETILTSDRVDWLRWLLDTSRHTRDAEVDHDGQQSGEQRREGVVHTTVLVDLDDLVNQPADEVHPREGRGEGKPGDDGIQGLRFKFLTHERDGFGSGRHILYITIRKNYSETSSSMNRIFLYSLA